MNTISPDLTSLNFDLTLSFAGTILIFALLLIISDFGIGGAFLNLHQ